MHAELLITNWFLGRLFHFLPFCFVLFLFVVPFFPFSSFFYFLYFIQNPKWIIWLIWAIVCHYTDKKTHVLHIFDRHFVLVLTHYGSNDSLGFFCVLSSFSFSRILGRPEPPLPPRLLRPWLYHLCQSHKTVFYFEIILSFKWNKYSYPMIPPPILAHTKVSVYLTRFRNAQFRLVTLRKSISWNLAPEEKIILFPPASQIFVYTNSLEKLLQNFCPFCIFILHFLYQCTN